MMEPQIIYEIIGYAASVLVAVSLMMSKIVSLRIVNMIGAATFSVYGVLIGSIPVAGMNAFIVLINIYFLYQIFTNREYFRLLRVEPDDAYLRHFLEFHRKQIGRYQPGFDHTTGSGSICLFILRDMIPAGLIIGELDRSGTLHLKLDFVIPMYRDFKTGQYLYSGQESYFRELGISEIRANKGTTEHDAYLKKMGFRTRDGHLVYTV